MSLVAGGSARGRNAYASLALSAFSSDAPTSARALAADYCALLALYGIASLILIFVADGRIGPPHGALGTDWMVYSSALRVAVAGNFHLLFDPDAFTAFTSQLFADWLPRPFEYRPWLYPPHFLLLLLPFGLLPYPLSLALFEAATFGALVLAWRGSQFGGSRLQILALALSPAAFMDLAAGQNAFLTAALLVGGFRLLPARPVLAGALFGVLTYKPQLWVLVPLALIATRSWRALASALLTAAGLVLLSVAVFGMDALALWINIVVHPPADFEERWLLWGTLPGFSPMICALLLGASGVVAAVLQFAGIGTAALVVYWAHRQAIDADLRLAIFLAAAMLISPHLQGYDLVLLAIAVILIFSRSLGDGFSRGQFLVLAIAWIMPFARPLNYAPMRVAPVFIVLVIVYAILKSGANSHQTERVAAR
jgi:alpha-1,2-mannosyltransferase